MAEAEGKAIVEESKELGDEEGVEEYDPEDNEADDKDLDEELLVKMEKGDLEENDDPDTETVVPEVDFFTANKFVIHKKEGLQCVDKELMKLQKKVILYLLKKVGSSLFRGGNPLNISLPVYIFDKQTYLSKLTAGYAYLPYYLEKAAAMEDPLEKIKYITAWAIPPLVMDLMQYEPFNPLWGETFQGTMGEYKVSLEQVSHHPPIPYIHIMGPKFVLYGPVEVKPKLYPNSAKVYRKTKTHIILNDKPHTCYELGYPVLNFLGIMMGKRFFKYSDQLLVRDLTNKMVADLRFNPGNFGFHNGVLSKQVTRKDYFTGVITKNKRFLKIRKSKKMLVGLEEDKGILGKIEGYWTDHIIIDGEELWSMKNNVSTPIIPIDNPLPSDSRFRLDLIAWKTDDTALAQKEKEKIEANTRNDRKLRSQGRKAQRKKKGVKKA